MRFEWIRMAFDGVLIHIFKYVEMVSLDFFGVEDRIRSNMKNSPRKYGSLTRTNN